MANSNRLKSSSLAFWCFVLSFSLLPVGLAGDRPIPFGLCQIGIAISYICVAINPDLIKSTPLFARLRLAAVLIVGVLIWAIIQTQPIVPNSWTHPLWQETSNVLKMAVVPSISIAPEDAIKGLLRLVTYIAAGVLAYVFGQNPKRARKMVTIFWAVGTAICLYGLAEYASKAEQILWFNKWAYKGDLTATFVNRNHFALYAGLVFTAGLGLLFQSWSRMINGTKKHHRIQAIREWLLQEGFPRVTLLVVAFICIILSHSRAGLVCSLFGMTCFLLLYQIYAGSWKRAVAALCVSALVVVISLSFAFEVSDRFASLFEDYSSQERAKVYELSERAIADNPYLGYGLNGFEPEFRLYQNGMYEEFNHAHSDLIESILDLGVIGGSGLWLAIGLLLTGLWHGVRRRRQDGLFPTLALASSLMILAHSSVDFDLQIPGLSLTWAVILGTGLAQSWQTAEKQKALA